MAAITPSIEARVRSLASAGLSSRKISGKLALEGVSLSHVNITRVLKKPARQEALEIMAAPHRGRATPGTGLSEPVDESSDAPELSLTAYPLDASAEDILAIMRGKLIEIRHLAIEAHRNKNLGGYRDMTRLELEVAEKLVELTPEPPMKPEDNPDNVQAQDLTRAKIADLFQDSEIQAGHLCTRCMLEVRSERE